MAFDRNGMTLRRRRHRRLSQKVGLACSPLSGKKKETLFGSSSPRTARCPSDSNEGRAVSPASLFFPGLSPVPCLAPAPELRGLSLAPPAGNQFSSCTSLDRRSEKNSKNAADVAVNDLQRPRRSPFEARQRAGSRRDPQPLAQTNEHGKKARSPMKLELYRSGRAALTAWT